MEVTEQPIKLVVVGDGAVGKTCILLAYSEDQVPRDYVPTICANYTTSVKVDKEFFDVSLWDTAGQEGYERLRALSYPETDIFLLCFSVISASSFKNIKAWDTEIRHNVPDAKVILVGTKIDLRDVPDLDLGEEGSPPTKEDAIAIAKEIAAESYMECSSYSGEGIAELFEAAVRIAVQLDAPTEPKKSRCPFL